MAKPANPKLYQKVKDEIYEQHPTHSAYRSALLVQEYKRRGGKYIGSKPKKKGLARWFEEEWRNQRGGIGYKRTGDIYRPTKRITAETPATMQELSTKTIKAAMKEKATTGRVKRFRAEKTMT